MASTKTHKTPPRYYVYILRCSDESLYTGYTTDIASRIKTHNAGKGAKAIRGKLPVRLAYLKEYRYLRPALKMEYAIKQLAKNGKEALGHKHERKRK